MSRRSYDQYCGLARALDVLGERWTLLIVRNLLLGPQRYSELLRGLPGITTNLLAKRLQEMEAEGIIDRAGGGNDAYRLTEVGRSLEPAIHALGRWGWQRMGKPRARDRRSIARDTIRNTGITFPTSGSVPRPTPSPAPIAGGTNASSAFMRSESRTASGRSRIAKS